MTHEEPHGRRKIATASRTKDIIRKHDFFVKKNYGQNFLVDSHVLQKIISAAELSRDDFVIEIGPGLGGLTQELAERAGKVAAIEIDPKLIPILRETLSGYDNVEVIHADVLKVDFKALLGETQPAQRVKLVANLPYYITTPIVMGLLEQNLPISQMIVMVQKEVAARMAAKPGTRDYGALSLAVQYRCEPYLVANVPRNSFIPRPNVDSAVIRLKVYDERPITCTDEPLLFTLIKCAFATRRKTLLNCLFSHEDFDWTKDEIKAMLQACGLDEHVRGEALALEDYVRLTDTVRRWN